MEKFLQDIRYGARMLMKKPVFTIIAVITLALAICANTSICRVVNAVLLRSLPYHNSERLVALSTKDPNGDTSGLSSPEFQDYQTRLSSFEDLTAFQSQSVNLTGGERPERVRGAFVASNFFKVFNLPPLVGRTFAEGEDGQGAENLAVVNEKMWRERLQSDPNLTGKKLILNGEPYSVIGVVTSAFKQPFDPDVEVWMPMAYYPGNRGQREFRALFGMGHLKPGATFAQTQSEAAIIAGHLADACPKENAGRVARVEFVQELMVGEIRPMLWLLFAAVGVILLIACANLANLLLARGLARQKEIAVRAALGASRWRLVRQLLTETTLISLIGGIGGLLVAYWGLFGLLKLPQNFVNAEEARLDGRVLLFALGISLVTGWLFGLVPALQLAKPELQSFLKEGARGAGEGSKWNRVRSAFVIAQVALSLPLLVSAGLLIRSFDKLLQVDVGFKTERLLTLEYRLPRTKYKDAATQWNFHRQVVEQIQQVPGVQSASLVRGLPFSGNGGTIRIVLPDREPAPKGMEPEVLLNTAMPNYFQTIGIPL